MKVNQRPIPMDRRVNPTRRVLVQVIKLATSIDLQQESKRFFNQFDTWVKAEGKRSAVLRLKAIHHTVLNRSLGQVPPQYSFLATVRGFPRAVTYLEKYCTSPEGIQAVLSLLGYWRGVRAPGIPDLTSISAGPTQEYSQDLEDLIADEIPDKWNFECDGLSPISHVYSTRFGPNGKRLYTALHDLKAIDGDVKLNDAISNYLEITDNETFSDYWEELRNSAELDEIEENCTHSRLSVKQELGGKDRVFAIVDYFTQCLLKPLHHHLSKILGTIKEDGTFNQDKAAEEIKRWTAQNHELYSYDLTAATDRLPVRLQERVLSELSQSDEFGAAWKDLMTNRSFTFRRKTGIKYSVGQPMGAYSSWPAFALTHHLIVRAAAKEAGIVKPQYRILGDDIVLLSKALAESYSRMIKRLGVEISMTKSVTGKVAEFAKRLFMQGREISGIPVKLLSSWLADYRLTPTVWQRLVAQSAKASASFDSVQSDFIELIDSVFTEEQARKARILLALASQPRDGLGALLNLVGNTHLHSKDPELNQEYLLLSTVVRYKYLTQQYSNEMKRSAKDPSIKLEFPGLHTGTIDLHPVHQAVSAQKAKAAQAHRALGKYWTALTQQGLTAELPNVNLPNIQELHPGYQRRLKHEANIALEIYSGFTRYLDQKQCQPDLNMRLFLQRSMGSGGSTA